jgi:hypothetical protein
VFIKSRLGKTWVHSFYDWELLVIKALRGNGGRVGWVGRSMSGLCMVGLNRACCGS